MLLEVRVVVGDKLLTMTAITRSAAAAAATAAVAAAVAWCSGLWFNVMPPPPLGRCDVSLNL